MQFNTKMFSVLLLLFHCCLLLNIFTLAVQDPTSITAMLTPKDEKDQQTHASNRHHSTAKSRPHKAPHTNSSTHRHHNNNNNDFTTHYQATHNHSFFLMDEHRFLLYKACNRDKRTSQKHAMSMMFLDAIVDHPWRVHNVQHANLIVIPALFDHFSRSACSKNYSNVEYYRNAIQQVKSLGHFPWKRHLALVGDSFSMHWSGYLRKYLPQLIVAEFDDFNRDCAFGLGYSNNYDVHILFPSVSKERISDHLIAKTKVPENYFPELSLANHKKRPYLAEFSGQADNRTSYRDRRMLFISKSVFKSKVFLTTWLSDNGGEVKHCNVTSMDEAIAAGISMDRCHTRMSSGQTQTVRENSRFSLCFRGDTLGSDRWENAFLAGAIPVAVEDSMQTAISWAPFRNEIPWQDIVVWIPRKEFLKNPVKAIESLASLPDEDVERRLQLMEKHRADLSFIAKDSRIATNVLHEAMTCKCKYFDHPVDLPKPL